MTTDTISVAARISEVSQTIADRTSERARVVESLEDELAVGRDVAALRKKLDHIDSALEIAEATKRGLDRLRIIELRDAHRLSIAEAESLKVEALAKFYALVAARDAAAVEHGRLEREVQRWGIERDNAATRVSRRQQAYANFCSANADAIMRAEELAENRTAGEPPAARTEIASCT